MKARKRVSIYECGGCFIEANAQSAGFNTANVTELPPDGWGLIRFPPSVPTVEDVDLCPACMKALVKWRAERLTAAVSMTSVPEERP